MLKPPVDHVVSLADIDDPDSLVAPDTLGFVLGWSAWLTAAGLMLLIAGTAARAVSRLWTHKSSPRHPFAG